MKLAALISPVALVCFGATFACANTLTFNFSGTSGSSTTASYNSSGVSITATGSANLIFKSAGSDETGLGLTNNFAHEIGVGQNVTFDLSSLFSQNVSALTLTLDSIESGESAMVCDGNGMCLTFGASDSNKAVNILSLYQDMLSNHSGQLKITGVTGQVLVNELDVTTVTSVPEPSTFLLLGTGVLAMAGAIQRRLR